MSYDPLLTALGLLTLATASDPATFQPTAARAAIRIAPAALPSSPGAGDLAIDSADNNILKWYDGTSWQSAGAGAGAVVSVNGFTGTVILTLGDFTAPGADGQFMYNGGSGVISATPYMDYSTTLGIPSAYVTLRTDPFGGGASPVLRLDGYSAPGYDLAGIVDFSNNGSPRWSFWPVNAESGVGDDGYDFRLRAHGGFGDEDILVITRDPAAVNGGVAVWSRPVALSPVALPATPVTGTMVVDSGDSNTLKWWNGAAWIDAGGGGGSPGGSNTSIQYNNSGVFGGTEATNILMEWNGFGLEYNRTNATSAGVPLQIYLTLAGAGTGTATYYGGYSSVRRTPTDTAITSQIGFYADAAHLGSNSAAISGALYGASFVAQNARTAGTLAEIRGANVNATTAAGGTTTIVRGLHTTVTAAGTVPTVYGQSTVVTLTNAVSGTNVFGQYIEVADSGTTTMEFCNGINVYIEDVSANNLYGIDVYVSSDRPNAPVIYGIRADVGATAGSGTNPNVRGITSTVTLSAGASYTTVFGARFEMQGAGTVTTAYGLYVEADTASMTVSGDAYGIYQVGASGVRNYFQNSVEVDAAQYYYWGAPNTDGSWRMGRSGSNLLIERREAGVWVTKQTFTP